MRLNLAPSAAAALAADGPLPRRPGPIADTLPDRQVADLSPLERHPCWHLKRDLAVLLDGSVPMCREDLRRDHLLGNLETDGIAAVWERGQEIHQRHLDQDYPEICRRCDEYYTYNN